MLREQKEQIVNWLSDELLQSGIVISTNYQGLSAKQIADLRNALTSVGAQYHVVKNSLAKLAADVAGKPKLVEIIEGPVALAFGYDDEVTVAKTLSQYIKSTGLSVQIRGGLLGERVLTAGEVVGMASLPPKEILIARLVGQIQAPLQSLHNVLGSPIRGLLTVLQNKVQYDNQ